MEDNIIYCFWTGNNPMSNKRAKNLNILKSKTGCNVILVTPETLNNYILDEHPLHPSYEYLSLTHKSDYLRTYFMRFYGSGYSDVKDTNGSWVRSFDLLRKSDDKWINGYKEKGPGGVAYDPAKEHWNKLIGNGCYICKPNTPFVIEWYNEMMKLMDEKYEKLKEYPASIPRDNRRLYKNRDECYPLEWNEMLGRIFHRVLLKYLPNVLQTVPMCICNDYK